MNSSMIILFKLIRRHLLTVNVHLVTSYILEPILAKPTD